MKTKGTSIKVVRVIQSPPEMIWGALTQASGLREWLCDEARVEPRRGGRIQMNWREGYEVCGVFTSFSPPRSLAFTWAGLDDPGESSVRFALKPVEGGTQVRLIHSGLGTGKKWAGWIEQAEGEWNDAMDNLQSVLETGVDLRQARLPRFGLRWEPAPDKAGALVTIVMERGPADLAGLRRGDVIVSFAGRKVRNEEDLMAAFRLCRAGQRVPIIYLREGKRRTTTVELDTRPVSEIPSDPVVLVEQAHKAHEQAIAALRASVMILTDEQAGMSPAECEWSVKQTLAHLSASERGFQSWAVDVLLGNETHWIEARLPEQFAAVFASAPTVGALLDRFERDMAETRAMVATLTGEHRANKARYRRIAQMLLDFAFHTEDHLQQIEKTIRAIQGK
jgi:uncharacterized protein YndB with AHSA1/START domain